MSPSRLLIIDDEPSIVAALERIGKSCGFATTSTTTAETFKERYMVVRPTVIMLDLAVPQTDGFELLRWLGNARCTATVLIISGFGVRIPEAAKLLGEARGLKMGATITKPFRVAHIRDLLTQLSHGL